MDIHFLTPAASGKGRKYLKLCFSEKCDDAAELYFDFNVRQLFEITPNPIRIESKKQPVSLQLKYLGSEEIAGPLRVQSTRRILSIAKLIRVSDLWTAEVTSASTMPWDLSGQELIRVQFVNRSGKTISVDCAVDVVMRRVLDAFPKSIPLTLSDGRFRGRVIAVVDPQQMDLLAFTTTNQNTSAAEVLPRIDRRYVVKNGVGLEVSFDQEMLLNQQQTGATLFITKVEGDLTPATKENSVSIVFVVSEN